MVNRFIFFLFCIFLLSESRGQVTCGFDFFHKKALASDPAYRKMVREQKQYLQQQQIKNKPDRNLRVSAVQYTIPVVVHIVHTGGGIGSAYNPTDLQIQNAINDLNTIYGGTKPGTEGVGDLEIRFALATRDPLCNNSTGITRTNGSGIANYVSNGVNVNQSGGTSQNNVKNLIRWDPSKYYNIWVVNEIDNHDGTIGGSFVGGFAYLPGAPANLDGTIMLASQMQANQKTLPHELGHAFGLYHPFEGGTTTTCPANADCTVDGDEVCDTDPVYQPATGVCRTGTNTCAGSAYHINTEHNYMNYTNCATLFTAGQKNRVLAFAASPYRYSLSLSWGSSTSYPLTPYVNPSPPSCVPATAAAGLAGNYAGLMGLELGGQMMVSGTTYTDGGYRDGTGGCLNLIQLVRGSAYTLSVRPLGSNYEQVRGWIDYNNNGIFDNSTEQIIYNNNIGPPDPLDISVSSTVNVPMSAVTNTVLRLRITEELGTIHNTSFLITGACYNPEYGQAEDYPVIIMDESVLPVSYAYFNASVQQRDVILNWKTISELNASHFILEKSAAGKSFQPLHQVNARGNESVYYATDKDPGAGIWYYRIRQVDLDGAVKYSPVRVVQIGSATIRVLTNPFSSEIRLQLNTPLKNTARIKLISSTGKTVYSVSVKPTGDDVIRLDLSTASVPAGIYFIEYRSGETVWREKLVRAN